MKRLIILLLLFGGYVQAQPSLCLVSGTLYGPTGDTAKGSVLTIVKAAKGGTIISTQRQKVVADTNGYVSFYLHRASTTWIYAPFSVYDSLGEAGVPVYVPDETTGTLGTFTRVGVPGYCSVIIPGSTDTTAMLRLTHPTIPGLFTSDTNQVIGVNASGGLVLRWDNAGGGSADTANIRQAMWTRGENEDAGFMKRDSIRTVVKDSIQAILLAFSDSLDASTRYPALNDLLAPTGDGSWNLSNKTLTYTFTNPAGGISYVWTGAASGHMFDLDQNTGNPGAGTHMLHVSADDVDVIPLHLSHANGAANVMLIDGGKSVITGTEGATISVTDSTLVIGQPVDKGGLHIYGGLLMGGTITSPTITALNNADAGYADADSISLQVVLIKNLIAGKADADSIHTELVTLYNMVAGNADADSVNVRFATQDNLNAGYGDADSLQNTAVIADAALPLVDLNDTLDVMTAGGARSISTAGRVFTAQDSIVITGAMNLDCATGNSFTGTTSGDATITFTNMLDGQSILLKITNGGTNTVAFAGVMWSGGGTAPVLTSGAGARDCFGFWKVGGLIYGFYEQNYTE